MGRKVWRSLSDHVWEHAHRGLHLDAGGQRRVCGPGWCLGRSPSFLHVPQRAFQSCFHNRDNAMVETQLLCRHRELAKQIPRSESTKKRRKAAASAMNRTAVATYTPLIEETSRDWIS